MNLIEETRSVLESADFQTTLGPSSTTTAYFEDDTVVGAVFVYESIETLVTNWEEFQDSFLGTNSRAIRSDPIKAWNIYTVHLTAERGTPSQLSSAFSIEQDFRGTRKIVRSGISQRSDLVEALLPLLPLQHHTFLTAGNITTRLRDRLSLTSHALAKLVEQPMLPNIEQDLLEES